MNLLTAVVDSMATDSIVVAAETVQENLNVLDLAMKGGWIMIILAILSVIGIYIFIERYAVLRKAAIKNPTLLERLNDNLIDKDFKSAINYCNEQCTIYNHAVIATEAVPAKHCTLYIVNCSLINSDL